MRCIELIASENFTSRAVMECLGSALTNKPRGKIQRTGLEVEF